VPTVIVIGVVVPHCWHALLSYVRVVVVVLLT
jgi:mannitol/fructose-specific phosphotransferase system IIA component (Ntr-type)